MEVKRRIFVASKDEYVVKLNHFQGNSGIAFIKNENAKCKMQNAKKKKNK